MPTVFAVNNANILHCALLKGNSWSNSNACIKPTALLGCFANNAHSVAVASKLIGKLQLLREVGLPSFMFRNAFFTSKLLIKY